MEMFFNEIIIIKLKRADSNERQKGIVTCNSGGPTALQAENEGIIRRYKIQMRVQRAARTSLEEGSEQK